MNSNFELTPGLRQFVDIATSYPFLTLGAKYPFSIRRRGYTSQSIYIYPNGDYQIFTGIEIMCFMSLANALRLTFCFRSHNGMVVMEVIDWLLD